MVTQKSIVRAKSNRTAVTMPVSEQEREIMAVGQSRHWDFRVLGIAPVPEQPIYFNNWWLVPASQDTSVVPARALERIRGIYEAGIHPKAVVIAHEAPREIAAPKGTPTISPFQFWTRKVGEHSLTGLKVLGAVAAVVIPVAATVLGASLLITFGLLAAMVDPCLIVVTEDDVWVQIDYWMV